MGKVSCLCISPDDRLAASSANDRHLSLWRVAPSSLSDDDVEPCVQTIALETTLVHLSLEGGSGGEAAGRDPVPCESYSLLALTESGLLSVWRLDPSAIFPRKRKKKKVRARELGRRGRERVREGGEMHGGCARMCIEDMLRPRVLT